jgi:hypothetical protein
MWTIKESVPTRMQDSHFNGQIHPPLSDEAFEARLDVSAQKQSPSGFDRAMAPHHSDPSRRDVGRIEGAAFLDRDLAFLLELILQRRHGDPLSFRFGAAINDGSSDLRPLAAGGRLVSFSRFMVIRVLFAALVG